MGGNASKYKMKTRWVSEALARIDAMGKVIRVTKDTY